MGVEVSAPRDMVWEIAGQDGRVGSEGVDDCHVAKGEEGFG